MIDLSQWEKAKTVAEMERGVAAMRTTKTARTLPILAGYDRQAVGIVRLFLFGALRIVVGLFLLYVVYRLSSFFIPFLLHVPRQYVAEIAGEQWSIAWFLLAVLLAIPYLLTSNAIHDVLIKQGQQMTPMLQLFASFITFFLIAVWLVIAMMPIAFALIAMAYGGWITRSEIWEMVWEVEYGWAYALGGVALLLLFLRPLIRSLFKRKSGLRPLLLFLLWLVGAFLWAMNWLAYEYIVTFPPIELSEQMMLWLARLEIMPLVIDFNEWLIEPKPAVIVWGIAGLAYPLGYGLWLAQWPARFLLYLTEAIQRIGRHLQLRWRIWQVMGKQRQRNQKQTLGAAWTTVCQEHLQRFALHSEKLSYGRWLHYAACAECEDDASVWTGVSACALHFDNAASDEVVLSDGTLLSNGAAWVEKHREAHESAESEIWFDGIVIGDVAGVDVEEFLTIYRGVSADKPLKTLSAHLLLSHNLSTNVIRQLESDMVMVQSPFDFETAVACPPKLTKRLRGREQRQRQRRNTRFALRAALGYGVAVLVVWVGWQLWERELAMPLLALLVKQVVP